jgi:hypothetical protein
MTHLGTKLTPLCGNVTVCELDKVESVLDILIKLTYRHMSILSLVLELACKTAAEYRKRLSADLLRKEEVLVESETI